MRAVELRGDLGQIFQRTREILDCLALLAHFGKRSALSRERFNKAHPGILDPFVELPHIRVGGRLMFGKSFCLLFARMVDGRRGIECKHVGRAVASRIEFRQTLEDFHRFLDGALGLAVFIA